MSIQQDGLKTGKWGGLQGCWTRSSTKTWCFMTPNKMFVFNVCSFRWILVSIFKQPLANHLWLSAKSNRKSWSNSWALQTVMPLDQRHFPKCRPSSFRNSTPWGMMPYTEVSTCPLLLPIHNPMLNFSTVRCKTKWASLKAKRCLGHCNHPLLSFISLSISIYIYINFTEEATRNMLN